LAFKPRNHQENELYWFYSKNYCLISIYLILLEGENYCMKYAELFQPIKIGTCQLKNRYAMSPMGVFGMTDENGVIILDKGRIQRGLYSASMFYTIMFLWQLFSNRLILFNKLLVICCCCHISRES
jgi:hypothetical protein